MITFSYDGLKYSYLRRLWQPFPLSSLFKIIISQIKWMSSSISGIFHYCTDIQSLSKEGIHLEPDLVFKVYWSQIDSREKFTKLMVSKSPLFFI